MSIDLPSEQRPGQDQDSSDGGSRKSTVSNQSNESGSTKTDESSRTTTTTPDTSISSINKDPSPALPLANPRKQKSTGILNLSRSSSFSRLRSGSTSSNNAPILEPVPPLPKIETQLPKSILTTSSSCSSLTNSPSPLPHTHSLTRIPSVQFAPLPQLAPRKRKSSVPLGIAARSAMMQRRRQIMYGTSAAATFEEDGPIQYSDSLPSPTPDGSDSRPRIIRSASEGGGMWTSEEAEEHYKRQVRSKEKEREKKLKRQQKEEEREAAKAAAREKYGYDNIPDGVEDDDPLVVFGRMMKDAWRKVGKKDKGKTKAKADPHIRTQAEAEADSAVRPLVESKKADILESDSVSNEDQGSADLEGKKSVEDNKNDVETEAEADIDPNEVDVSKIVPLRSGSPPPSAPPLQRTDSYQSQSDTSSIAETDVDADADANTTVESSDSLSTTTTVMTTPSSPTPTEYYTPTATDFPESPTSTQSQTQTHKHRRLNDPHSRT
ncbi:hypothetical protein BT96DRAFT_913260, partial [Gymnopus androsaceus JB14]